MEDQLQQMLHVQQLQAMQQMQHSMQQQAQAKAAAAQPAAADNNKKDKMSTSSVPIMKLPRVRLAEAVERVTSLDGATTTDVNQECLAVILWCFTRVKPNVQCTELRANTYDDFYGCLKKAAERVKAHDETTYQRTLHAFQNATTISNILVMEEAIKLGFDPAYMEKQKKRGKRELDETKQTLAELFKKKKSDDNQVQQQRQQQQTPLSSASSGGSGGEPSVGPQAATHALLESMQSQQNLLAELVSKVGTGGVGSQRRRSRAHQEPLLQLTDGSVGPRAAAQPEQQPQQVTTSPARQHQQPQEAQQACQQPQEPLQTNQPGQQQQPPPQVQHHADGEPPQQQHEPLQAREQPDGGQPQAQQTQEPQQPSEQEQPQQQRQPQSSDYDPNKCAFCQDTIDPHGVGDSAVEALRCGHVFHTSCVNDYCTALNKTRYNCCPFKCDSSPAMAAAASIAAATEPEPPQGQPQPGQQQQQQRQENRDAASAVADVELIS